MTGAAGETKKTTKTVKSWIKRDKTLHPRQLQVTKQSESECTLRWFGDCDLVV